MCGIWGIFNLKDSWTTKEDLDIANTMSLLSTQRGEHSTGYCFVQKQPANTTDGHYTPPHIIRSVGSPFSIRHQAEGAKALTTGNVYASSIFGHNRHATRGAIKTSNAHPFTSGDWVLVHNGTLHGGVTLSEGIEVDSHALCQKIDQVGIKEALMTIDGAFAIIAYNKRTHKIYAARNGERTLFMYKHDPYAYCMSEEQDLDYVLRKYGRKLYWKGTDETGLIKPFEPHVLYEVTDKGFEDIDTVKPKPKVYAKTTTVYPPTLPAPKSTTFTKNNQLMENPLSEVSFVVERIASRNGVQHRYEGIGGELEDVVFYSKQHMPDLIGKTGFAMPFGIMTDVDGKKTYQVRFRDIEWDNRVDPVGPITSPLKKVHVCCDCANIADVTTGAIKLHDDTYMCSNCVTDFQRNTGRKLHPIEAVH